MLQKQNNNNNNKKVLCHCAGFPVFATTDCFFCNVIGGRKTLQKVTNINGAQGIRRMSPDPFVGPLGTRLVGSGHKTISIAQDAFQPIASAGLGDGDCSHAWHTLVVIVPLAWRGRGEGVHRNHYRSSPLAWTKSENCCC